MDNPIPEAVLSLIDQVCEPDPEKSDPHQERPKGITPEIVQQLQNLSDTEVAWLPRAVVLYEQFPSASFLPIQHDMQKAWAAGKLASHIGPKVIPFVVQEMEATDDSSAKRKMIEVLGNIGEPALESLDSIFFETEEIGLVTQMVEIFLEIGQPAAYLIALAVCRRGIRRSTFGPFLRSK